MIWVLISFSLRKISRYFQILSIKLTRYRNCRKTSWWLRQIHIFRPHTTYSTKFSEKCQTFAQPFIYGIALWENVVFCQTSTHFPNEPTPNPWLQIFVFEIPDAHTPTWFDILWRRSFEAPGCDWSHKTEQTWQFQLAQPSLSGFQWCRKDSAVSLRNI